MKPHANPDTFPASAFHPDLGNSVANGTIELTAFVLRFTWEDQSLEIPFEELKFRFGEGDDERFYFYTASQPEWTIFTPDCEILDHRAFQKNTHLRYRLSSIQGKRSYRKAIIITASFFVFFGLGALFLSWLTGYLVLSLVSNIPASWEKSLGDSLYSELSQEFTIITDTNRTAELELITAQLSKGLPDTNIAIQFHIVDNEIPNAFAIPGGHIFVHTGLFDFAGSREELAGVLAHEIAHIERKHGFRKIISTAGPYFILQTAFGNKRGTLPMLAKNSQALVGQTFSREYEREADDSGWDYLVKADINPRGMIDFFERLKELEKKMVSLELLSSHPATDDRIEALERRWTKLKKKSEFIDLRELK